jgi:NAD(P)-dependent dehydrogenase (short-subunit alcohol dehydrogenase family)
MTRNIIVTGAAGNLGRAVVQKFKREGYQIIATILPGSGDVVEEVDDAYEVDLTNEVSVTEFYKEYQMQYGEVDAIVHLVGGFAMGNLENSSVKDFEKMIQLNFITAFTMVKNFLPLMKKANYGHFLFVGARPALNIEDAKEVLAYALSKGMVISLADIVAQEAKNTKIRSHVFVPSIIDTPENRVAMPDADFTKWVNPEEIAEAMHYAVNNHALRNMTFKLYGEV